ncbi:hypothetical protein CERSUDRAFT_40827, partial [Gelatoporia subvermispora B]
RPPFTYQSLIGQALLSSPDGALTSQEILDWITRHYPYYEASKISWQRNLRHALTLSNVFQRVNSHK